MLKTPLIRVLILLVCLIGVAQPFIQAHGAEPVKIGVLAYRPKPQTMAQWQPLADALKQSMPEHDFVVEALTYPEMDRAVAARQLDFVLTNSSHYVLLSRRSGLSSPLATVTMNDNGRRAMAYGGVIFTRAEQADVNALGDIKGKTIAIVGAEALAGYQMQAYELKQAGIELPRDAKLIATDMPHDNVVNAVLGGRADVGFVRSGVLEGMAREGKLDMAQIKIVNRQNLPEFPLAVSTRLYPEWPFAAMPHLDENLTRHVAAALFEIEENTAATRAMGIHGFGVPADYTPVSNLLRELRLPPFEAMPAFTLRDIEARYRWQIIAVLLAGGLILMLGLGLLLAIHRLNTEKRIVLRQQQQLQESESRLRAIIENEPECIKIIDAQGRLVLMNPAGLAMIEADSLAQVAGGQVIDLIAPEYREAYAELMKRVLAGEAMQMEYEVIGLKGRRRWLETHAVPMRDKGETVHLAVTRDIAERKLAEAEILRSNAELEQFSYSISHDMRQPLRMISSYLQLLEMGLKDQLDSEKREYFNFAIDGAKRMDAMMLGLLEYSRVGRKGEPPDWVESRAVLDEALLFLQPAIAEAQARVSIEGDWPKVFASPDELLRLMQNLIGNALKFRVAGRTPEVTVRSEVVGSADVSRTRSAVPESAGETPALPTSALPGVALPLHWQLSVTDNGVGILPDQIGRLFQVFQRLQSRAAYEGTGIGLALCRKIAEHHGGRVWAESAGEGQGSTFKLSLPMRDPGAAS